VSCESTESVQFVLPAVRDLTTFIQRILALTGPAGAGKTATLRVLAKELNLEIVEWRNATEDTPIEGESWGQSFESACISLN